MHASHKIVDIMLQVHRAFKAFSNPDRDLTRFVELEIFPECYQVLVSWPHGIDPWLARPDIRRP
jgi:hypothetical protein